MTKNPRPRVLFVDDDEAILRAFSSALRKDRSRWDMVFAHGGKAALAELSTGTFDVVLTDMSMPGIDGVAVLQAARERSPSARRIVLSGQAAPEAMQRVQQVAHQMLAKPCRLDAIRAAIELVTPALIAE